LEFNKEYFMRSQHAIINNTLESQKGFSLIELMIAIAIFSIGLLAVATMQVSAISGNAGARQITDALIMAEDQLENLMALPYASAELDPALNPHQIDAGGYSMVWNVAMADLNGDGTNDAKQIQVTVSHQLNVDKGATIQHLIPEP
jgi:prepilin-type N-terminal cleavage/methylation domain-containing protein